VRKKGYHGSKHLCFEKENPMRTPKRFKFIPIYDIMCLWSNNTVTGGSFHGRCPVH
jgi:hypothetical protein